jgi:phosphoglycolate phosphatase-like HAD superfamily hydrolase
MKEIPLNLAILDLDGTLTQTNQVDSECFIRAIEDSFALTGIETDWSSYRHPTDAGILEELFQRHFNRSPSASEVANMQNCFVGHLQRIADHDSSAFSAVRGAEHLLTHLRTVGWAYIVATGCWSLSAHLKIRAANLVIPCPVISCDDAISRVEILKQAIDISSHFYSVDGFSRIVNFADNVWDVKTAKSLRLPFVGIAQGSRADRLRSLGVSHVLPNFMDLDAVLTALNDAKVPVECHAFGEGRS